MLEPLMCCIAGTRPELIKMAPVMRALTCLPLRTYCLHTAQHTALAAQAASDVQMQPDWCLLPRTTQGTLASLLSKLVDDIDAALRHLKPDAVLVHGDTASAWAATQAAFYAGIPVAHIEAGLRCPTLHEPFPEEAHRRLIGRLAQWHFAPTAAAQRNLAQEGIHDNVVVTGNTAIDSVLHLTDRWTAQKHQPSERLLAAWQTEPGPHCTDAPPIHEPIRLLVTAHRRENWGRPIETIITALAHWLSQSERHQVIWLLHGNPMLVNHVESFIQQTISVCLRPRFQCLPALSYADMVWALQHCNAVATDSGGLQEEASAFFKPVFILRNDTERPEAIESGYARLTGTDPQTLLHALADLTNGAWPSEPPLEHNLRWPFGNGRAGQRIARHLANAFGVPASNALELA